jgi:hypothetical protein
LINLCPAAAACWSLAHATVPSSHLFCVTTVCSDFYIFLAL